MSYTPRLSPEDQQKVDRFLHSGVNATERKPFRLWRLLGVIWLVLVAMSLASYWIALQHGVV